MLSITTPASSRALLTETELRVAAGLAADDTSRDAELAEAGIRAADIISEYCRVAGDGVRPVTLLQETLVETFRCHGHGTGPLILARRFVSSITSVVSGGSMLDVGAYEVEGSSGLLWRLSSDSRSHWQPGKTIVTYVAGFATPPSALKEAATKIVRLNLSASSRDPLVKRERIDVPDVEQIEAEYWVGPVTGGAIPRDVQQLLAPYMTVTV